MKLTDETVQKIHNGVYGVKDYEPYQLYEEARKWAEGQAREGGQDVVYWASWRAARTTAACLLAKAKEIGVTDEQWEELRKVAATVATD